jgi:hypothetical protein
VTAYLVTSCDVFADHEPDRAVASVQLVGGGTYTVRLSIPEWATDVAAGFEKSSFGTYDEALAFATQYATALDGAQVAPTDMRTFMGLVAVKEAAYNDLQAKYDALVAKVAEPQ